MKIVIALLVYIYPPIMSFAKARPNRPRRMKPPKQMVDGDVDSASYVTFTPYEEVQSDGTTIVKTIKQRLDNDTRPPTAGPSTAESSSAGQLQMNHPSLLDDFNNDPIEDMPPSPPPLTKKKGRVSVDILL